MKIKGFTLLECLIALLMISLFFLPIPQLIQHSREVGMLVFGRSEQEWQVFLMQFENKLAEGTFVSVEKEKLHFQKFNEESQKYTSGRIDYSSTKKAIIIRDNGGYEPALLNVEKLTFSQQNQTIYFEVLFENGEIRIAKWTFPKT